MTRFRTFLALWLPPLVWMAVIMNFSADEWSATETSRILVPLLGWLLPWATPSEIAMLHGLIRKLAHVTEYGILAALWFRALVRGPSLAPRTAALIALAISVAWASADEIHQLTVPSRSGSAVDVALDGSGAVMALVIMTGDRRRLVDRTTGMLLWTAAIGGTIVLVIGRLAGVEGGALWLTVPVAVAALVVRRVWRS